VTPDGVTFARLDADGAQDRFQRLRAPLGVSSFGINLIVLEPGQRGRVHRHSEQEEVYLVLAGELTLVLADGEHVLRANDLARVGPEVRRQLVNRGPGRLELLALGGHGEHRGRDGIAWASWDEPGDGRTPQEVPLPDDLS
jgi:uncharacterized cupin superfamily protein